MSNYTPLLISHIPKTAGTSLKRLVEKYHPDTVFAYKQELALGSPDIEFIRKFRERPKPRIVMGHFSFGVHRLLGVEPNYTSIFREPIQRVVSLYRYQITLTESPFARELESGMTLSEFVTSGITPMTNNHMCRMVSGVAPEDGIILKDKWLLEYALHNLEHYYHDIGIVERYEHSLTKLAKVLGWSDHKPPMENVTTGGALVVDKETYEILYESNQLDVELYKKVLDMCQ